MALNDQEEAALRAQLATAETRRQAAEQAAEDRRKALETAKAEHKAALDTAAADHAKRLDEHRVERQGWTTERLLLERGLTDPVDRKVALLLHDELPKDGRPELGAWLDGLKTDATKIPRQLAHVLGVTGAGQQQGAQAGSGQQAGGTNQGQQRQVQPPPKQGETSAGAGGKVTVEQLREAGQRARRQGATDADRSAYNDLCARLDAEKAG